MVPPRYVWYGKIGYIGFVALLDVPALDHRLQWARVPVGVVAESDLLVVIGFLLIARGYRENKFTAATIQILVPRNKLSGSRN